MRKFEFSFKSYLFVINRCNETEINVEVCKKEYEKIFEINKREQKWNEIISKEVYSQYNEFKIRR